MLHRPGGCSSAVGGSAPEQPDQGPRGADGFVCRGQLQENATRRIDAVRQGPRTGVRPRLDADHLGDGGVEADDQGQVLWGCHTLGPGAWSVSPPNGVVGNQTLSYQLTHDANGNLTRKQNTADATDTTTYRWDSNNRLIGITQTGPNPLSASFTYDALGRRIQSSITQGGQTRTVQYLYEGQQHLGEIRDGKISHRLLTGLSLDETIARMALTPAGSKDPAGSRLYLTDALNSVIAQLNDDAQATLANSYAYSPFEVGL